MRRLASLQRGRGLACAVAKRFVRLGARGGGWIERLQILKRQPAEPRRETRLIGEAAQFVLKRYDHQAHLKAPIAEMGVAPDFVAAKAEDALQAFADDRGAQMPHMHALGDIGPAIINEHTPRLRDNLGAGARIGRNFLRARRQRRIGDREIEKSGAGQGRRGRHIHGAPRRRDLASHVRGLAPDRFRHRESAIALEVAKIGPVGPAHPRVRGVKAERGEHTNRRRRQSLR